MTKECVICSNTFDAVREDRQYCDKCQKNTSIAREYMEINLAINRRNAGDLYHNQLKTGSCKQCGKQFETYEGREFCSGSCRDQYRLENEKCRVCGTNLFSAGFEAGHHYCSSECREKSQWKNARDKGIVSKCEHCGEEFINPGLKNAFCKSCRAIVNGKQKSQPQDSSPSVPDFVDDKCIVCGAAFQRHRNATKYTCSRECSEKRRKTLLKETAERKKSGITPKSRGTKSVTAAQLKRNELREKAVRAAFDGLLNGKDASELHLCSGCRTSQATCIMFTSNFKYHPEGAKVKLIEGNRVVLVCPEYKI